MRWRRSIMLLLPVALAGCGPGKGDLTGAVTLDGRPVLHGTVQVLPADKIPRSALIAEGRYTLRKIPAGPVTIAVNSPDPRTQRIATRRPADKEKAEAAPAAEQWFAIPERYASFEESGLRFEVRPGENRFDLELTP